ncbi:hypothetical protein SY88_22495 [Clostridiales bacterium PH28_bin88]|nr:hypothetical protein SY88_22495 [Clostridiales bacterium PH28_bin88]
MLTVIYPFPVAWAQELNLKAKGVILMDADSGQILYEQDADARWYPASVTKVMTLLLALEAVEEGRACLDDTVIASEYACSFGGSQVWLEPGEKFPLEQMLIAVAVGSANDASVAVAEHIAGSEEAFVEMMNQKAKKLGATNTHFTNPHGLHNDEHYTSARDMALISRYALRYPKMLELTAIKEYTFREEPKLVLWNTNKLLWWYPGTDGLKTGTTSEGGRSLASTVEREGLRLIGVVMGVDYAKGHFSESMKLYNYGFARFGFKQFFAPTDIVQHIPVAKGDRDSLPVVPARKVGAMVPKGKGEGLVTRIELPPMVTAPVAQGQRVGEVVVLRDNQELSRVDLLAAETVGRGSLLREVGKVWHRVVVP